MFRPWDCVGQLNINILQMIYGNKVHASNIIWFQSLIVSSFFISAFSDVASLNSGFTQVSSSFPLSAISLMVSSSPFYDEAVNSMVVATNMVYREFLKSNEGQGFRGEVCTKSIVCVYCRVLNVCVSPCFSL